MQDKKQNHNIHFSGQILVGFDPEALFAREAHRKEMLPPDDILPQFRTRTDAVMLDLGCGAGLFTLPTARFLTAGVPRSGIPLQPSPIESPAGLRRL